MNVRRFPFLAVHFDENAPAAVAEAPAAAVAETPAAVTAPSLKDRVAALKGEARQHWQMEGDLDAAEAIGKTIPDVTSAPSTDTPSETPATAVESEAASEPAVEEQPKQGESPEQKAERKHRNDVRRLRELGKIESELAAERAKRELLEKQIAESKVASAPTKTEETKPVVDPSKPKRPRLDQYKTVEDYEAAMDTYEEARDQWRNTSLEQREASKTQQQQFQQASEKWENQKAAARKEFGKDFDAVAFNPKTPASLPQIVEIQARDDAAKIMFYLGKNPDVSKKIAELTDIPSQYGKFDTWAELNTAMAKNPGLAYLVGEKRGLAKAEIQRIGESLSKKATPSNKDTIAQQPKPSGEVTIENRGTPVVDERADLIRRASQGDKAAARRFKEIENKRDLQEAGVI